MKIRLSAAVLLSEVKEATGRVSGLVAAMKSYAQLDRASVQFIDVTEGIDDAFGGGVVGEKVLPELGLTLYRADHRRIIHHELWHVDPLSISRLDSTFLLE